MGIFSNKFIKQVDNFDALVWWKHNSGQYHILSIMAKDILAIQCLLLFQKVLSAQGVEY
jgi:hypothetical protein